MTSLDYAMNKASIVSIVSQYVHLRRTGREYKGLCPFHREKTASFAVNEDKGVFYCFGCGAKGDVFDFMMQIEGIDFREAKARLGVTDEYIPKPEPSRVQLEAAELAATWMIEQRRKINILLGDVLERIELADEVGDGELAESLLREQSFLRDLYEDLDISRYATDLLSIRQTLEAITEGIEPDIHFEFPPLTPECRAHLEAIVGG
jgi:DNA primase